MFAQRNPRAELLGLAAGLLACTSYTRAVVQYETRLAEVQRVEQGLPVSNNPNNALPAAKVSETVATWLTVFAAYGYIRKKNHIFSPTSNGPMLAPLILFTLPLSTVWSVAYPGVLQESVSVDPNNIIRMKIASRLAGVMSFMIEFAKSLTVAAAAKFYCDRK